MNTTAENQNPPKEQERKKASKVSVVASVILCIILIPIILVNVILIVGSYTDPDHIPSVFGISPAVVLSGSMSPTFDTQALIFIQDVEPDSLEVGDIICFLQNGTAITHRIIEVTQEGYITQGDANNVADGDVVTPQQIEGKYIAHLDEAGGFVMFAQSTTGMILFIAVPICIYVVFDFLLHNKERKEEQEKTKKLQQELEDLRNQK